MAARTERVAWVAPGRLQARSTAGRNRRWKKPETSVEKDFPPVASNRANQYPALPEMLPCMEAEPDQGAQRPPHVVELEPFPAIVRPSRWYEHPWRNLAGPRSLVHLEMHRGSLETLLYLSERTSGSKSAIYQALCPNGQTLDRCITTLIHLGLVHESRQANFPFRRTYSLSNRGAKLVRSPLASWPGLLTLE